MKNLSAFYWRQIRGALALAGLVWVVGAACAPSAQAQTYSPLYRFTGGTKDGENPEAGLAMDTLGNFYGTVVNGPLCSPTPCTNNSLGMVFELTPTGTRTILHRFRGAPSGCGTTGQPACDGANPYGGLLRNAANGFYGTTSAGGASNMGTVFKVATAGLKLLHSFTGPPGDGAFPYAGLIADSSGNFYGTTSAGGAYNNGAVFKISAAGTETLLYSFTGGPDGGTPYGSLLRDSAGNLYGTASTGGTTTGNCFPSGCGVVFVVTPADTQHVLYSFAGSPDDGAFPYSALVPDAAGNLYGTTYNGGNGPCTNGCGAVFEVPRTGTESLLHSFQGYPADGAFPYAGLVRDSTGNLYGTTAYGGSSDNGAVFELAAGTEKLLYSFAGTTDGAVPRAPLILDSTGNLYGTTYLGGVTTAGCGGDPTDSCGVVFKLTP
jgi:uncharacterized repeat protein (TIGR03803 family)